MTKQGTKRCLSTMSNEISIAPLATVLRNSLLRDLIRGKAVLIKPTAEPAHRWHFLPYCGNHVPLALQMFGECVNATPETPFAMSDYGPFIPK
jgi:hypothetical protein